MKRKTRRHLHHRKTTIARALRSDTNYLVIIRGWMFIVLFAVMLGIGAVVGNFLNQQLNQTTPQVAGAQISR